MRLGVHEFAIESDGGLLANDNAASLEGSVPGQSEVLTIDLCGRRDRSSSVAPCILRRWRGSFNRRAHLVGYAALGMFPVIIDIYKSYQTLNSMCRMP